MARMRYRGQSGLRELQLLWRLRGVRQLSAADLNKSEPRGLERVPCGAECAQRHVSCRWISRNSDAMRYSSFAICNMFNLSRLIVCEPPWAR